MSAFKELLQNEELEKEFAYLRERPKGKARFLHAAFQGFSKFLFYTYTPHKTFGRELLPEPPYMICSNHCSHMDSTALMHAGGLGFNQYGMVAAKDYFFDTKRKNSLPLLMNLIPADRKSNRETIARLMAACREFLQPGGRAIIIYPEGTRSLDGEMAPLKKGPAMIAAELEIPIVPAYIKGTFASFPKGVSFPRPRKIRVHFGEAIDPKKIAEEESSNRLVYTKITDLLTERITKLKEDSENAS